MPETIKQECAQLTLSQETTLLCKNITYLLGGKESDVETLIKDAVHFYIRHREDNTSPHIQNNIEQTLIDRFDALAANLQDNLDNTVLNKLLELMLSYGLETELIRLMLKDQYCRDSKSITRYEQLRRFVFTKVGKQCERDKTTELLELRETVRLLKKQTTKYIDELQKNKLSKNELKQQLGQTSAEYSALAQQYSDVVNNLEKSAKLVRWYERLVREVPRIRKKNSGLIREQSWEGAVTDFIRDNPRPS